MTVGAGTPGGAGGWQGAGSLLSSPVLPWTGSWLWGQETDGSQGRQPSAVPVQQTPSP